MRFFEIDIFETYSITGNVKWNLQTVVMEQAGEAAPSPAPAEEEESYSYSEICFKVHCEEDQEDAYDVR